MRVTAEEVGIQPRIVSKWRWRFAEHGLGGLKDRPPASAESFRDVDREVIRTSALTPLPEEEVDDNDDDEDDRPRVKCAFTRAKHLGRFSPKRPYNLTGL